VSASTTQAIAARQFMPIRVGESCRVVDQAAGMLSHP
jgi:hypothetical protein